ncbi:uncharacterized protein LOC129216994 [Uloborus diversus]|uniref:uncharacterized protein LOC129216994 n=1 Tax=Uloborus diversus TaxID=327109 RepID=UPI0024090118|nr:uncharacterized protein LOC129216994 [Uloborus diversus]
MPPPPPPAPPPLPKLPTGAKSGNSQPPPDRNALLSQIRKGTQLKKAETNDRSQPAIEGKTSSSTSNKRTVDSKSNGPFPIIPPGGLFAQGIPKLRPTTPRNGDSAPSSLVIQSIKSGSSASSLDHLRVGQLSGSRSQPPSPVSKPRVANYRTPSLEIKENFNASGGNPNFPNDVNFKGPAPIPPPASQKPVFRSNTKVEPSVQPDSSVKHTTVKRSASQTNLGQRPRLTRPPPNVKPPPPPKSSPVAPPQSVPPPPPSKPPNILRRQSFGTGESHNSRFTSMKLSVANNSAPKPVAKSIGPPPPPPPPPRNNSAPNDLNQMGTNSSPGNHWNKMNIAPPPPPNRAALVNSRSAPVRPPPPRAPAPPPPPPPQHQFPAHPAPPSQLKAMPATNMAPTPPTRVSSMKQSADFEERFKSMFCPAQNLPKPDKFMNIQKSYPSKLNRQKQSTRRLPPPPPPQNRTNLTDAGRSQPVLHIQLDSGIFSNNVAHC